MQFCFDRSVRNLQHARRLKRTRQSAARPVVQQAEFTEQVAEVNKRLSELVYPSSVESQAAGTDAQQRVRQLFTSAGLNLASSQMLEPKVEGGCVRVSVRQQPGRVVIEVSELTTQFGRQVIHDRLNLQIRKGELVVVENAGQFVIFCNREPIRRVV